jgi:hypothetical protein
LRGDELGAERAAECWASRCGDWRWFLGGLAEQGELGESEAELGGGARARWE